MIFLIINLIKYVNLVDLTILYLVSYNNKKKNLVFMHSRL